MSMGPEYARFRVRFSVRGRIHQATRTVSLMENYTTWADIPKILAISEGTDEEDIVITHLESVFIPRRDDDTMGAEGPNLSVIKG